MIIEFIGSTGAGKTTLIKHILYSCEREGIDAVVGTDFVLKQSQLNGIKSDLLRAVLVNLISLSASLAAWRNNPEFYRFVFQDEAVLVERILTRGHARVPDHSVTDAAHFIKQAVNVFDELVQNPAIEQRVVVVDGAQKIVMALGSGTSSRMTSVAKLVQAGLQVSAEKVAI